MRSRGQETTLLFVVDGVQLDGSFTKVRSWKITPRAELPESDFVGESESEVDFMHHGFDFSCEIDTLDAKALDLYDAIVAANAAGTPLPRIDITAITSFRNPAIKPRVDVCESTRLKLDGYEVGSRKDYVKSTLSGKFKTKGKI